MPSDLNSSNPATIKDFTPKYQVFIILSGIILPIIALMVEFFTNLCSSTCFNPIPTIWHVLLIASVPVATFIIGWSLRNHRLNNTPFIAWLNGAMVGITALYTLRFLPLTVFACFGIIIYGLGLLALAPHFALIAAIFCRMNVKRANVNRVEPEYRRKDTIRFWCGVMLAVSLLVIIDLPVTFTRIGVQMSQSDSESTRLRGIHWLRNFGDNDFLLRSCYVRPGVSDLFGIFFKPAMPDQAREIYYRVTGIPFNSVPRLKFTERNGSFFDDADFSSKITRDKQEFVVKERIFSQGGESWTDVSSWYWSALLGKTTGPWWSVVITENGKMKEI